MEKWDYWWHWLSRSAARYRQVKTVKGTVMMPKANHLIGVNVAVKGQQRGAITDRWKARPGGQPWGQPAVFLYRLQLSIDCGWS